MPSFSWLFLLFIGVPLLEIYLLIKVGSLIGGLPTILLVVLTAIVGIAMLRWQGISALARVHHALERGELPALELLESMMLLIGGVLFLTPGFVTDLCGFLCLVPRFRSAVALWVLQRSQIFVQRRTAEAESRVFEGKWKREDD
jgi:UPF0716 protein FxsA